MDTVDGTEQWRFDAGGEVASPTVVDGTVYIGSYDSGLHAVDAETGTEQWNFETAYVTKSSPTVANGTVYIGSGILHAVDAQTGAEQWRFPDGGVVASPAVAEETVYVSSEGSNLYAIDTQTGAE